MTKLLILIGFFLAAPSYAQIAVLTKKIGEIKVKNTRTNETKELSEGQPITRFDSITVPAGGAAQFIFSNNNVLQMTADSEVAVEQYEFDKATKLDHSILNVKKGKVHYASRNVYDGFRNSAIVKTQGLSVSGDNFNIVIDAKAESSQVVSLSGDVAVGELEGRKLKNTKVLKSGFKIKSKDEKASEPEEVDAAEIADDKKLDLPVVRGPFDDYAHSNPSFAIRYKPSAYVKLRNRMEAKKRK